MQKLFVSKNTSYFRPSENWSPVSTSAKIKGQQGGLKMVIPKRVHWLLTSFLAPQSWLRRSNLLAGPRELRNRRQTRRQCWQVSSLLNHDFREAIHWQDLKSWAIASKPEGSASSWHRHEEQNWNHEGAQLWQLVYNFFIYRFLKRL